MTIEELIEKRKKLGISRKEMARLTGYSYDWLNAIEWKGERRVSDDFIKKYSKVIKMYEKIQEEK